MDDRLRALRRAWRGGLPEVPVTGAEDARWSVVSSAVDTAGRPADRLVELLLAAAQAARGIDLEDLAARCDPTTARYVRQWPGEHYRLLAGLTRVLRPATVVEIGTFQGHGTLALRAGHPATRVVTYDLVPWRQVPGAVLTEADFAAGLVEQRLGDVVLPDVLATELDTLRAADLLFVDAPKDGRWEPRFCAEVLPLLADRPRLVVFDDVRLLEMVQLWRDLPYPTLDATSLGHWSGTGLLLTA